MREFSYQRKVLVRSDEAACEVRWPSCVLYTDRVSGRCWNVVAVIGIGRKRGLRVEVGLRDYMEGAQSCQAAYAPCCSRAEIVETVA